VQRTPPLLSIVTVVLNDPEGLVRTGNSLLNQTLRPEWVVVDGGSSKSTLDVLQNFGCEVRWVSGKDKGIYDAMNKGVGMCQGDYVVFLNAGDCFSDSGVVADVSSFLSDSQNLRVDVLCCGANLVLADGRKVYRPHKIVDEYIWHGLPANHQATYYRRLLLGAQPYDLKFKICGDYFLAATLYERNAIFGYLERPVVEFSLDGVSSKWRKELFMEPYTIQQHVLLLGLGWRILSLLKRVLSGMVLRLFDMPLLGDSFFRVFSYIRSRR
jgi:putative colanic acid biosynthesis glycosyltransferase